MFMEIARKSIFLIKSGCLYFYSNDISCKLFDIWEEREEWGVERSINCDRRLTVSVTLTELRNKLCFESVKFWRLFIICKYLESLQSVGIQTDANEPKRIYVVGGLRRASNRVMFIIRNQGGTVWVWFLIKISVWLPGKPGMWDTSG